MKRIPLLLATALLLVQPRLHAEDSLAALATQAVSADASIAQSAQDKLRAAGPTGLNALTTQFSSQINAHRVGQPNDASWKLLGSALDRVSGQYDDYASGLYWYTDLEKAKQASATTGRPILSLRMLGKLDTDLSCANSRFFRTTLYPNAEVNQFLKDHFILHWESVRPVPVVTIDFGDGRKLVRTVTGNSVHYVLDSQGRVVDALPGLYSAKMFVAELKKITTALASFSKQDPAVYAAYQEGRAQALRGEWAADLNRIDPSALPAPQEVPPAINQMADLMTEKKWQAIANLHQDGTILDNRALQLISNKFPSAQDASYLTMSKTAVERPIVRALKPLQDNIAADSYLNNYQLRSKILSFLASSQNQDRSLPGITDWVYANVFLTPPNDPWLGLAPSNIVAAIDNDGRTQPPEVDAVSLRRSSNAIIAPSFSRSAISK